MAIVRIQHSVASFEGWKKAFDGDPLGRKAGGVQRYRVLRSVSDPNFVMIDLEFAATDRAEAFARKLREFLGGPGKAFASGAQVTVAEAVEAREL